MSIIILLLPYMEAQNVSYRLRQREPWDAPHNVGLLQDFTPRWIECPAWREDSWNESTEPPKGHLAWTNYIGVAGVGTDAPQLPDDDPRISIIGYDRKLKVEQIKDGLENTVLLMETGSELGSWARGGPATVRGIDLSDEPVLGKSRPFGGLHIVDSYSFRRTRPTGTNILMADGSVRYVQDSVNPAIFPALATVAGNDSLPSDW